MYGALGNVMVKDCEDICEVMHGFQLIIVRQIENYIYRGASAGGGHYYV